MQAVEGAGLFSALSFSGAVAALAFKNDSDPLAKKLSSTYQQFVQDQLGISQRGWRLPRARFIERSHLFTGMFPFTEN